MTWEQFKAFIKASDIWYRDLDDNLQIDGHIYREAFERFMEECKQTRT